LHWWFERSAAAGKTVASTPPAPPRPDPQVVTNAKRRAFTAEYKLGILAEADAATAQPGAIGALLRRGTPRYRPRHCPEREGIRRRQILRAVQDGFASDSVDQCQLASEAGSRKEAHIGESMNIDFTFYFKIMGDTYRPEEIKRHSK